MEDLVGFYQRADGRSKKKLLGLIFSNKIEFDENILPKFSFTPPINYSVSNMHEVEVFFNQLQKVFAVEKMLLENDQSIREMYNLLEVKHNTEIL